MPTVAESGVPGYSALQWYGVLAPAGTPQPAIVKLQAAIAEALRMPDVRERLAQDGAEPIGGTSEDFAALIRSDLEKWSRIAKAANIQAGIDEARTTGRTATHSNGRTSMLRLAIAVPALLTALLAAPLARRRNRTGRTSR